MNRIWISVVASIMVILGLWSTVPVLQAWAASAGEVLIVEVGADPTSAFVEPAGEFIEIYNTTASNIDVGGWKLCDNSTGTTDGCRTIPTGTSLGPGKILVVIHAQSELGTTGWNCGNSVNAVEFSDGWFAGGSGANLANKNDHLLLLDTSSTQIDEVSYGTDVTAFSPAATDVFNNSGATLQRKTYNSSFSDSNTANDWMTSTGSGTPCDVGPTAITLRALNARAAPVSPLVIALPALGLVAAGGVVAYRRRKA